MTIILVQHYNIPRIVEIANVTIRLITIIRIVLIVRNFKNEKPTIVPKTATVDATTEIDVCIPLQDMYKIVGMYTPTLAISIIREQEAEVAIYSSGSNSVPIKKAERIAPCKPVKPPKNPAITPPKTMYFL